MTVIINKDKLNNLAGEIWKYLAGIGSVTISRLQLD